MLRRSKSKGRIDEKRVTIIGIGGLGANTSLLLTQAGVKNLKLIDFDRVEACNLNRGQVFTYNDVGKYKVEVAAQNIEKVNPSANVERIVKEMRSYDDIAKEIEGADFVVRSADKPIHYFNEWFNRACIHMDKPFISGGMNEYIGVYGPLCIPRRSPCLLCSGTVNATQHMRVINLDTLLNPSWGPVMGFIGDLLANDIIAYLQGRVTSVSHTQYIIDAATMKIIPVKITRNKDCAVCGSAAGDETADADSRQADS